MIALQKIRSGNHLQLIDDAAIMLEWNTVYSQHLGSFPLVGEEASILLCLPALSTLEIGQCFSVEFVNDAATDIVEVTFLARSGVGQQYVAFCVPNVCLETGCAVTVQFMPNVGPVVVDGIRIDRVH